MHNFIFSAVLLTITVMSSLPLTKTATGLLLAFTSISPVIGTPINTLSHGIVNATDRAHVPAECVFKTGGDFEYFRFELLQGHTACFGVENHTLSPGSTCGSGSWSDAERNDIVSATMTQIAKHGSHTKTNIGNWTSHFMHGTSAFKEVSDAATLTAYALNFQGLGNQYKYKTFYFSYDGDFVQTHLDKHQCP